VVKDLRAVPAVRASEGRLGQVFLNLLVNAAQAIPEGQVERNEIRVSARPIPGERVVIEVSDTGCGIPADVLPRIFDPFFTTKPPGVGTGLGLSIVHGIVTGMHGEIQVESTPGKGTTFRITLPLAPPEAAEPPEAGAAPRSGARARILVVDDEPMVGTVLQRTLAPEHEVVTCAGVDQALARLDAGEAFQLIFSDLLMPGRTGMDLHRALLEHHPAMAGRLVFLTGGACSEAARTFLAQPGMEYIEKPFDLDALRGLIARRLAAGEAEVVAADA
jgi:CheY-like chemotaxis protein